MTRIPAAVSPARVYARVPFGSTGHVVVDGHAACNPKLPLDGQRLGADAVAGCPYLVFCLSCERCYPRTESPR